MEAVSAVMRYWVSALWPLVGKTVGKTRRADISPSVYVQTDSRSESQMAGIFKIPGSGEDVESTPVVHSDGKPVETELGSESMQARPRVPLFHVPGPTVGRSVNVGNDHADGRGSGSVDSVRLQAGSAVAVDALEGDRPHAGGTRPMSPFAGAASRRSPFNAPATSSGSDSDDAGSGMRSSDDAVQAARPSMASPSTASYRDARIRSGVRGRDAADGATPFSVPASSSVVDASTGDGSHDAGPVSSANPPVDAAALSTAASKSPFIAPLTHVDGSGSDGAARASASEAVDRDEPTTPRGGDASTGAGVPSGQGATAGARADGSRGDHRHGIGLDSVPAGSVVGSVVGRPRTASSDGDGVDGPVDGGLAGDFHAASAGHVDGGKRGLGDARGNSSPSGGSGVGSGSWSPDSFLDVGAGFDPGWSDTVGAGEDAPAFTGGSFLDLGDEDESGFDDGGDGSYGEPDVGSYVPSGDGETAGFVTDDGSVVRGDLDLPQSWKATTTHDPGDDGRQSIAWNKDGKAAAVKPSEERLTVIKRYHRATREEMGVRREVAEQVAEQGGLPDEGGALLDPRSAKPVRGSSAATGGSGDKEIDEKALRFGVRVGTGKARLEKQLRNKHDVDAAIARRVQVLEWKKGFHVTFGAKEVRGLDYLTRWSYATTAQIARVVGWRDRKECRLVRALEKWEEMGWVRQDVVFSGPRLWYPRRDGAELSEHAWLGGVSPTRVNPMSQSHSLGLSSIGSWLLCGWGDAPDILQLGEAEWRQLQADVKKGEALVISEKEYRAPWTRIRQTHKGLLPAEYRHAFIGDVTHGGEGRYQQWARDYKSGQAKLEDSPDWVACDPTIQGDDMWIWTLWSNSVWNPKLALDAARMDGVTVDDVDRAAQLQAISDYRMSGYVPVEDRLDIASNKPVVNKEMGDAFALLDHLPDLIVARKRDPRTGAARSIAIELELTAKQPADYARSMAGFGSVLGQTLYDQVIWLVPSKAVARAIELGARSVGLEEGVDYRIVPFASAEKRNSFWSGADIVPAAFDKYHRVQPLIDPSTFLLS